MRYTINTCGVIGSPIKHSLSPLIHQHFAKKCGIGISYIKMEGSSVSFEEQVKRFFDLGGLGLNVTMPFKHRACDLAQHRSHLVADSTSANTLWLNTDGEVCADSTDGIGLLFALNRLTDIHDKTILLIGAGGAVQAVLPVLLDQSFAKITVCNRGGERLRIIEERFPNVECKLFDALDGEQFHIIINASSSGLTGDVPNIPFQIVKNTVCMDMYYDRLKNTPFIAKCIEFGAATVSDGMAMLVGQAGASFERWHKVMPSVELTLAYLRATC